MPAAPPVEGTGTEIRGVVEDLTIAINRMIMDLSPENQMEPRSAMVLNLIDYIQTSSALTPSALLLLSYYLLQPNQVCEVGSCSRFGTVAVQHIAEALQESFSSQASSSMSSQPLNQEDVVPLLPALGLMIVEVITFMENREWQSEGIGTEESRDLSDDPVNDLTCDGSSGTGGEGDAGGTPSGDVGPPDAARDLDEVVREEARSPVHGHSGLPEGSVRAPPIAARPEEAMTYQVWATQALVTRSRVPRTRSVLRQWGKAGVETYAGMTEMAGVPKTKRKESTVQAKGSQQKCKRST